MSQVTEILSAIEQGDPQAASQLLPLVYDELRNLAATKLAQEKSGQTLQPTALVHEAYLRLIGNDPGKPWDGRGHFFAAAAEAMRRILVDHARGKQSTKRGGTRKREALADLPEAVSEAADDLVALDEALARLAACQPRKAELVKLRYFAGMTIKEVAAFLGISTATANREWVYARAWLLAEIAGETTDSLSPGRDPD